MEKIKTIRDIKIYGLGIIKQGTEFEVIKSNSRYVYVNYNKGVEMRLSAKDCQQCKKNIKKLKD